jgi:lysophospholipase L1-like esterase
MGVPPLSQANKNLLKLKAIAALVFVVAVLNILSSTEASGPGGHWVSAWSAAMHAPLPFPGLPPSPVFEKQTIRMVVRPTIAGTGVRIRLSNAFGTAPLKIGAAHIALAAQEAKIVPESDHALTFGGALSVIIPPGAPILSDPVDLKVSQFGEIAVSLFLPEKTSSSTVHFLGQRPTYISQAGDFTGQADMSNPTTKVSWYWLADVEVFASQQTAATATLGDSITDGAGAKQGDYTDWPDLLANRLAAQQGLAGLAVVNEGIGGNRILHDGAGISALARLDRDVLAQPGIVNLIVLEGINDIGWPHMKPRMPNGDTMKESPFAHELVTAQDLIMGLQQIIERAHQHGIKVFGATLTPYEGDDSYSEDGEATRQALNQWIRSSRAFDGVFDFDAVVRNPDHPSRFREGYHSGDHLHPSATGYQAMANSVDLSMLRSGMNPSKKN